MTKLWCVALWLAAALWLPQGTEARAAAGTCALPEHQASTRPGGPTEPTEVTVGVRMIDLTDINDVDQTLSGEFLVLQRWTDPRLAAIEGCEVPLADVWTPSIGFVNSGHLFHGLPEVARIGIGGEITYVQTFFGTLASYETLEEFPFDEHTFEVWLTPATYPESEVLLQIEEQYTGRRDLLNISDWTIGDVTGSIKSELMHATADRHSTFELQIPATRLQGFYVWKIFLPLCLIVMMSWVVFWIDAENFGPQIGLSATAMLTLIAFLFATTNIVPRLGYFTKFDLFLGFSLVLVFLAFIESLITTYLIGRKEMALARRIDLVSRFLFPAAFVVIIVGVLIL